MNSAGKSMLVCALLSGVLGGFAEETQWKQFPIWGGGYVQNVEISKSSPKYGTPMSTSAVPTAATMRETAGVRFTRSIPSTNATAA